MSTEPIQPLPGRRPVYPVDVDAGGGSESPPAKPVPPEGWKDDPASDANTESANHPNDE